MVIENYPNKSSVGLLFNEKEKGHPVNDSEKASVLNDYFNSVNITDDNNLPPLCPKADSSSIDGGEFPPGLLIGLCKKGKNKGCDPGNYSPYVLKKVIHSL
jgi:hypothetical protein